MDFHHKYPDSPDGIMKREPANPEPSPTHLIPAEGPALNDLIKETVEGVLEEVADFIRAQYPEIEQCDPATGSLSGGRNDPSGTAEAQPADPVAQRAFGIPPTLRNVCQGITVAGEPCRSFARNNADYCFMHDPASAEEADAARSNGAARVNALRRFEAVGQLSTAEDLRDFSAEILKAAAAGHLTPQALHALESSLARHSKLISDAFFEKKHKHP